MSIDFDERPARLRRLVFWQCFLAIVAGLIYLYSFSEQTLLAWNLGLAALTARLGNQALRPITGEEFKAVLLLLYGLLGAIAYFLLSVFFLSHFLLPIQHWGDYLFVFVRQVCYLIGFHGPAVFIRDGTQQAEPEELSRHQPGVIFIDLASAVILEKLWEQPGKPEDGLKPFIHPNDFAEFDAQLGNNEQNLKQAPFRILGPGVSFTRYGERIAGVVDLRRQVRFERDLEAFTRDGIQVKANVSVVFTLGEHPAILPVTKVGDRFQVIKIEDKIVLSSDGTTSIHTQQVGGLMDELDEQDQKELAAFHRNLSGLVLEDAEFPPAIPYIFSTSRVFHALNSRAFDPKNTEAPPAEWHNLPTRVASEMFRNILAHETFDALHAPEDPKDFPVLAVKKHFAQRMKGQGVLGFQYFGRTDQRALANGDMLDDPLIWKGPKRLFRSSKVLRDCGIKVIYASFGELNPTDEIVRQRQRENARARWQSQAIKNQAGQNLQVGRILIQARAQAQQDMIFSLSQIFRSSPHSEEALAMRIYQALEAVATDPKARKFLPSDTINMLWSLRQWLNPGGQQGQDMLSNGNNPLPPGSNLPDQHGTSEK